MPINLSKLYSDLLELAHLTELQRSTSLLGVFRRDIENNPTLNFRSKVIRPVKGEEPSMQILFKHLTTEETQINDEQTGKLYPKRIFELSRSLRLHWIRYHLEENKKSNIEVFSVEERDQKRRKDIIRTYIYDIDQQYIIVLDPQRSNQDYYLITAYHLNRDFGLKKIKKMLARRLPQVY